MADESRPYRGLDIQRIAEEELFKAAIRGLNAWKDNISRGQGATGSHGGPFVNTGEARADLTISPQSPDSLEYIVGGDVFQLFVAEFGRAPNNSLPPREAIMDWVQEKGIAQRGTDEFDGIVFAIQRGIAEKGIKGFAPGQAAGLESRRGLEASVARRIRDELSG